MSRNKAAGTRWESSIVEYLRDPGWPHAERRAPSGARDRGDIAGLPGVVIEAKACRAVDLAGWLDEATVEQANAAVNVGAVWVKRRGRTNPGAGYVVMCGATFAGCSEKRGTDRDHHVADTADRSTGMGPADPDAPQLPAAVRHRPRALVVLRPRRHRGGRQRLPTLPGGH